MTRQPSTRTATDCAVCGTSITRHPVDDRLGHYFRAVGDASTRTEPRTAAGRRIFDEKPIGWTGQDWRAAVLSIEAEAAAPAAPRTADDVMNEDYTYVEPKYAAAFRDGWKAREAEAAAPAGLDVDVLRQCPSLMAILNRLGKFNEAWWDRLAAEYARLLRDKRDDT